MGVSSTECCTLSEDRSSIEDSCEEGRRGTALGGGIAVALLVELLDGLASGVVED